MSISGTIMAVGALASAGVNAVGAQDAASAQESAANKAMTYEEQQSKAALATQDTEWANQQQNQQPFLSAGTQATNELAASTAPGGDLVTPWNQTFTAPTAAQAAQTPGYQFAMQQGTQALQRSAAAQGNLLSGGTVKDLTKFAQGTADSNYQQAFNNSLTQYGTAYNQFQQAQQNKYSRLMGVSSVGQTAAGQLGQEGQAMASNEGNIRMTGAQQVGQQYNNIGNAQAMGDIGTANAIGSGLTSISKIPAMAAMYGNNSGSTNTPFIQGGSAPTGSFQQTGLNPPSAPAMTPLPSALTSTSYTPMPTQATDYSNLNPASFVTPFDMTQMAGA